VTILTKTTLRQAAFGLCAAVAVSGASVAAQAADISGAGATFPYPIYSKWADSYKKETNVGLNYQSIGSGGGIKQIKAKTVTFGASDMPLKPEDLEASGLVQWPQVMGGVVPVINLKGLKSGEIKLSGTVLGNIYLGEIKKWNDDQIKALNPGVSLPNTAIAPVYRSDGSGTNFLFTDYLSKASPKFGTQIGANTSVQWPAGIGAKGNEGVANMVKQTEGAIGYVEYAYAKQNNIPYAALKNKDGNVVMPTIQAFQAAATNADWANSKGYYVILTDEPGAESWPITGASFILMHKNPQDPATAAEALKFFDWAYKDGAKLATDLDYVPMPDAVVQMVRKTWAEQIKAGDKPVWTAAASK
jgi:phosphate transport system substrate-binding protein